MAKTAILVPYPEMYELANPLIGQYPNVDVMCLEYIQTPQVEARVKNLENQGCELIIARGLHAQLIRHSVKIPLVEIRITAQELGIVILDIKRELKHECPRIGLLGFDNMFCDTKPFHALFGVDLKTYLVKRSEDLVKAVYQAAEDGCQAVVGGSLVCAHAQAMGLPNYFIPSGVESLQIALETASRVGYAIDLEKRNNSEMDTMLNNTFTGIMRIDGKGVVTNLNRAGCNLLNHTTAEVTGRPVTEVLPGLARGTLEEALMQGKETYAFLLNIQRGTLVVNLAPVYFAGEIEGAILTFQEGQRIQEMDSELRRKMHQYGYVAQFSFEKIFSESKQARSLEILGRRIAKYDAPVLLTGEIGSGKNIMAQCIHNDSPFSCNAFVWLDCSAWQPETADTMLFGNYTTRKDTPACMVELARGGTLYLSHVDALSSEMQYKLLNLIQGRFLHNGSNRPTQAKVRIIASTNVNLPAKVKQNAFRSDLYYALSTLSMELPPLRERREDIPGWISFYMEKYREKYKRYVHLTQDAQKFMRGYDWPGNLDQMKNVCERIVLLTEHRNVDAGFVHQQVEDVTPVLMPGTEKVIVYKDPKAEEVAEVLRRHKGNRAAAAAELGVSKTTLWRYINMYGIKKDFTC